MSETGFTEDTAYDVFISSSSKDNTVRDALCQFLEEKGFRCWFAERNILGGLDYAEEIVQALDNAKIFVVICSNHSLHSQWVLKETNLAVKRNKFIIPFKIDNCSLEKSGMELYLNDRHWIEAVPYPNPRALNDLARAIQAILNAKREGTRPTSQEHPQSNLTQRIIEAQTTSEQVSQPDTHDQKEKDQAQAPQSDQPKQFVYNQRIYSKEQVLKIAEFQPWLLTCTIISIALVILEVFFSMVQEDAALGGTMILAYISCVIDDVLLVSLKSAKKESTLFTTILAGAFLIIPCVNSIFLPFIPYEIYCSKKILEAAGLKTDFACVSKLDLAIFEENN